MNVKSEVPKKEPAQKYEPTRNNIVEQKTESLLNELKSIPLNAVQGNTCPNCSADLNLAEKLKIIKYIDCPSCEDSILLENVLEGNKCPNCLNDLADAEIIKLKIIICPKCKKIVKG